MYVCHLTWLRGVPTIHSLYLTAPSGTRSPDRVACSKGADLDIDPNKSVRSDHAYSSLYLTGTAVEHSGAHIMARHSVGLAQHAMKGACAV